VWPWAIVNAEVTNMNFVLTAVHTARIPAALFTFEIYGVVSKIGA
jgi:hypothetical protein